MGKIKLEIEAEPTQVEALRMFLEGKDTCLEFEIARYIESLYKKNVPNIVRNYLSATLKKQEHRKEV